MWLNHPLCGVFSVACVQAGTRLVSVVQSRGVSAIQNAGNLCNTVGGGVNGTWYISCRLSASHGHFSVSVGQSDT